MNKIIIGILAVLGLGVAGTGLYFADGTPVTDTEIVQVCEQVQQCKICVTDTIEMSSGTLIINDNGVKTSFTIEQIKNLKKLEIK